MKIITKKTTLAEVLDNKKTIEVLAEYQLPCLRCPMARFEMDGLTLEEVCIRYNVNLKDLLERLNKSLEK